MNQPRGDNVNVKIQNISLSADDGSIDREITLIDKEVLSISKEIKSRQLFDKLLDRGQIGTAQKVLHFIVKVN